MKTVGDLAHARSGDKGSDANIGVVAFSSDSYHLLDDFLTAERVGAYFGCKVARYSLENLEAFNFILYDVLDELAVDAQGKALGQQLLEMNYEPD